MPRIPAIPLPRGDRWMPTREVAALFGVNKETVSRWVREGKIVGYAPTDRGQFFKKSDVNKLLESKGLPTLV